MILFLKCVIFNEMSVQVEKSGKDRNADGIEVDKNACIIYYGTKI